jgi:hypothetical protein
MPTITAFLPDRREGLYSGCFLPEKAIFQRQSAGFLNKQPEPVGKKGLTAYRPSDVF